jgi:hypothetical protein
MSRNSKRLSIKKHQKKCKTPIKTNVDEENYKKVIEITLKCQNHAKNYQT